MGFRANSCVLAGALSGLLAALLAMPVTAAPCAVPSKIYATIQAAIDDPVCDPITVAPGTFEEEPVIGRSLALRGAGADLTFIQGRVRVTAGTVWLEDLRIPTEPGLSSPALSAASGAQVNAVGVVVVSGAIVFRDGFETGNTAQWTATVP